jgi:hypothetical protein
LRRESKQGKARLRFKKTLKDAFNFKPSAHSVLPFCITPIKTTVMSVKYSETVSQFPFLATVYTEPPLHRALSSHYLTRVSKFNSFFLTEIRAAIPTEVQGSTVNKKLPFCLIKHHAIKTYEALEA